MNLDEYKSATEIALEQPVEVKHFIYCYRDKALNKYNPPFVTDKEPAFMVEGLKNSIIKGAAKPEQIGGLDFCFVGTFELTSGKSEFYPVPVKIVSCDELLERFQIGDENHVS